MMVSRDVVFDEKKACNWGEKNDGKTGSTQAVVPWAFEIQYEDTVHGLTTDHDAVPVADVTGAGGDQASPQP
jgi:hypothetical protein